MHTSTKTNFLLFGLLVTISSASFAKIAITPGVTINMINKIELIEDEPMREMLKTAVLPNFGELYLDLDRPDEELTTFEQNYKAHPLTWEERVENVNFLLDESDDLSALNTQNAEYMDISFGESVIPVQDRRVTEILNTDFLLDEAQQLEEEKQEKLSELYENGESGNSFQQIEDEYATKMATLIQTENKFKEAKVDFLKLKNQHQYGRIDDNEFNDSTLNVVKDFENFANLAGNMAIFSEDELRAISNKIYSEEASEVSTTTNQDTEVNNESYWYKALSLIILLAALTLGYLAFRRYKK